MILKTKFLFKIVSQLAVTIRIINLDYTHHQVLDTQEILS